MFDPDDKPPSRFAWLIDLTLWVILTVSAVAVLFVAARHAIERYGS
jgi:hypothetical protein